MSEKPHRVPLTVLPHSGKVDQLRAEAEAESKAKVAVASALQSVDSESAHDRRVEMPFQSAAVSPPFPAGSAATVPAALTGEASGLPPTSPGEAGVRLRRKLIEGKVIEAVRGVSDPEIPINIYELGLIYAIEVRDDDTVAVKMTLTAPACPVAGSLPGEVEKRIEAIPEVKSASVELVWDPPWDRSRMSEEALLTLGLL